MPPRRIAFCITELNPGGAERALVELVTRLPTDEWECQVFCLGPEAEFASVLRKRGIPVTCLGAKSTLDWGVVHRLSRLLSEYKPDLLQTFLFHANVAGRWAGRRAGIPVIVSGLRVAEREKRWHIWLDRWTGAARYPAVCVSRGVADWANQALGIPQTQVHIIPNGVDFQRFAQAEPETDARLGIPAESLVVVGIGRLHRQKGFDLLLEAMQPLFRESPRLHLLLAGEGPERARLEEAALQIAPGRFRLLGRWNNIPGLLKRADLFVLSSRWEGMPNVLLEALAAGTPVIATCVEGVPEILDQPGDPRVVTPCSSDELRQSIARFLSAPEMFQRLAIESQNIIRNSFTMDSTAHSYAVLYRQLLNPMNR